MTPHDAFDRRLKTWLDVAAAGGMPDALLESVLESTRERRSRPGWIVALRGGGMSATIHLGGQPIHRVAYVLLLVALALVAALLLAGVGARHLRTNGRIAFYRTSDSTSSGSAFMIDPDGSNETSMPAGIGALSPDGSKRVGGFCQSWCRPVITNAEGTSGFRILDAYPGRKMDLVPSAWSPDGSRILVWSGIEDGDPSDAGLYTVRSSDGGDLKRLVETPGDVGDTPLGYSPDGSRILFSRIGAEPGVFVVKADGGGLRQLSPPNWRPVNLESWHDLSADWSPDGSHVVFAATETLAQSPALYLVDPDGTSLNEIVSPEVGAWSARWSPNGDMIALTSDHRGTGTPDGEKLGQPQVWVINGDGSGLRQLTNGADGSNSATPVWSPDGTKLLFQRKQNDQVALWTMNADGSEQTQLTALPVAGDFVGGYVWAASAAR